MMFSCPTTGDTSEDTNSNELLIKQVSENDLPYVKYTYSDNRIATKAYYDDGLLYMTDHHDYPISEQRIYLNGTTKEVTYEYY